MKRLAKICATIDGQPWRYTNSAGITFPIGFAAQAHHPKKLLSNILGGVSC
jgi:hypothetical protein